MRRLPKGGAEASDEVRLGDMRHRGHGADIEWLGVGAVHGVAGTQEAPVQVFDFPAHRATLRHQEGPLNKLARYSRLSSGVVGLQWPWAPEE